MIVRSSTKSFTRQDDRPIHTTLGGRAGRVLIAVFAALGLLIGTAAIASPAQAASDPVTVMKNGRGITFAAVNPSSEAPNQDFKVFTHGYSGKVRLTIRVYVQNWDGEFPSKTYKVNVNAGTRILSIPLALEADAAGCVFVDVSAAEVNGKRRTPIADIQTYVTEDGSLNDKVRVKR